nr:RNA-directed DNA polymerase, eukaryota, reverse transcriptase zinc-binding domain protein [Tanacetum cinerariifolium]
MEDISLIDVKCCWGNYAFEYVYSPVDYLVHVISKWDGEVIVMGDFNEVRFKNERFGSLFHAHRADAFNRFILQANFQKIPLGGCSFTWCHRSAKKMSKLDRFLMSEGLLGVNPNFSALTLDRYLSDHRPIMLRDSSHDYGPIPFRMYHYWFEIDGFEEMISKAWCECLIVEVNPMLYLMYKMKFLKKCIRWWNGKRQSNKCKKKAFKKDLHDLEIVIDQGNATDDILYKRMKIIKDIQEAEKVDNLEAAQKAKIKWAIEADENTKFYRGILNKKRHQLGIRGVLKDVAAVQHFFTSGNFPKGCNASFIALIPKIPDAKLVKDFRLISLIGSLYKIIAKILANRLVGVLGDLVSEVQLAFVMDRKILDGPLILNEDFLGDILNHFGFGAKWCGWIQECLRSSRGSVLVNGSPTEEFQFYKGLKQGDLLSPFLFILVMESLHLSFKRVEDAGSKVGGCMSWIKSWDEVIDKMVNRLSKWKMKTLSIGGSSFGQFGGSDVKSIEG